jgi:hypothetical protein
MRRLDFQMIIFFIVEYIFYLSALWFFATNCAPCFDIASDDKKTGEIPVLRLYIATGPEIWSNRHFPYG